MHNRKLADYKTSLICAMVTIAACSVHAAAQSGVTIIESPAAGNSAEPHFSRGPDGSIVMSWLQREDDEAILNYSVLEDGAWRPAHEVARGNDWFVNWADFPSVMPVSSELWAAHWLVKRPGNAYSYDVAIALSQDGGMTWSDSISPHDDDTATEHGFVSLFPWRSGVGAIWLDGRNMVEGGHSSDAHSAGAGHDSQGQAGGMTLRSAVVTAGRAVSEPNLVDGLVCDCCQTDVALGKHGPIGVYRDRTEDEVRDINVVRAVDAKWQSPIPIGDDGWKIAGCPVNGPAIAADDSSVAVAWFTAANDESRVRLAVSRDGGESFLDPVDIEIRKPVGRVDVEMLGQGDVFVSWLRSTESGEGELQVRRISAGGALGPAYVVTKLSTARMSGFPQMMRSHDKLVFAWTDVSGDGSIVRTASVDIDAIG